MTDNLRTLAEAEAVAEEAYLNTPGEAFIQGFIAGRTSVTEEQIAEVVAKANYDWSQQRLEFWRRPASVESPGDLDQYIARAVRALFGEVAGDESHGNDH